MPVQLDHTIVGAREAQATATWFAEVFGLAPPRRFSVFWQVDLANGVSLDFDDRHDGDVPFEHYAFLVSEPEFDAVLARLVERGVTHYADPGGRQAGEINHHDGGRGTYFSSPDGHWLEIITRRYGSGGT